MRVIEPGLIPHRWSGELIPHRWSGEPIFATLIERPNKFLAICRIAGGAVESHVPDRGRCLDLLVAGQPLVLVEVGGQERRGARRTRYTVLLARARTPPSPWVSLDPAGAPRLVAAALARGLLPELAGCSVVRRELTLPRLRARPRPRIDLLLRSPSGEDIACEVKSVGAARGGVALFPDAPSASPGAGCRLRSSSARSAATCARSRRTSRSIRRSRERSGRRAARAWPSPAFAARPTPAGWSCSARCRCCRRYFVSAAEFTGALAGAFGGSGSRTSVHGPFSFGSFG